MVRGQERSSGTDLKGMREKEELAKESRQPSGNASSEVGKKLYRR